MKITVPALLYPVPGLKASEYLPIAVFHTRVPAPPWLSGGGVGVGRWCWREGEGAYSAVDKRVVYNVNDTPVMERFGICNEVTENTHIFFFS